VEIKGKGGKRLATQIFWVGLKTGLEGIKNQVAVIEGAVDYGDMQYILKQISILVGQTTNLQAMVAAKSVCELSEAEKK
jgi:hypothetical protein